VSFETSAAVVDGKVTTHATGLRLNNVTELRLLFAASVMLSHAATLLDAASYRLVRTVLNSDAAVQGFFILSGYLVFGSYNRLRSPTQFYKRRLLRIYPAYGVAVLLFIVLGIAQALVLGHAVNWAEVPSYLAANLTTLNFLQPSVDGVFASNPRDAVNGALWSIKVELMFYAAVPLLFVIGKRISFFALGSLLILAGVVWWPALNWLGEQYGIVPHPSLRNQLPGQLHYFGLGIALFARSQGSLSNLGIAAMTVGAALLLAALGATSQAVQALVLVALIGGISALKRSNDLLGGQDLSYGIYLSHFPIIQLLLAFGVGAAPFPVYLAAVVALSVAYGIFSWRWIEGPALVWGGHKSLLPNRRKSASQ
jgi:peptidoglycan/LPS O-acetylase OafA/YrhL